MRASIMLAPHLGQRGRTIARVTPAKIEHEYRLFRGETIPQNNPSNPKYRAMIALWRRLPLRLANRLGPAVVRNLG